MRLASVIAGIMGMTSMYMHTDKSTAAALFALAAWFMSIANSTTLVKIIGHD